LMAMMGGPLTEERQRFTAQSMQLFADRVQPLLRANELEKAAAL